MVSESSESVSTVQTCAGKRLRVLFFFFLSPHLAVGLCELFLTTVKHSQAEVHLVSFSVKLLQFSHFLTYVYVCVWWG